MVNKTLLILGGSAIAIAGASFLAYNHGSSSAEDRVNLAWAEEREEQLEEELKYKEELNKIILDLRDSNSKVTEKVRVEYVDRVDRITEVKYQNNDVIKEVFKTSPYMTKGWVYAHDQLAKNQSIDPNLASNNELSDFTWKDSLEVIGINYSIAETARQKDESWNEFYEGVSYNFTTSSVQSGEAARNREPSSSPPRIEETTPTSGDN